MSTSAPSPSRRVQVTHTAHPFDAAAFDRKPAKKAKSTGKGKAKEKTLRFNLDEDAEGMRASISNHLRFTYARDEETATKRDWYLSVSMAVRDRIMQRFIETMGRHHEANTRRVYYLSLEYLMGRLMGNNLINAGLYRATCQALESLGLDADAVLDEEVDMGLGNGGLGRLAACFLDSLATLDLPAVGYGIHYEFGLFRQEFIDHKQVERPDNWLQFRNPWLVLRPEYAIRVRLYGHIEEGINSRGDYAPKWVGTRDVIGVPHDIPICGYGGHTVNFLRLWEAKASEEFDLDIFNDGGYVDAVQQKAISETVTKVLYPNDSSESGKELRLVQQVFFVACSLRDIIRRYQKNNDGWANFPEKVAIQLNDTHPAVAVPELMRIFLDEEGMEWSEAWGLCTQVFSYTNHTLLPEALEKWSVPLFRKVLPRHLSIIFEINRRFLEDVVEAKWPDDGEKKQKLSLIEEGGVQHIRMAHLSVIASTAVNGVAALHTELLKSRLFPEFDELFPGRLQNKTNGVTPRRWLKQCNPGLANLIDQHIKTDWVTNLDELRGLESLAEDSDFQDAFMAVKRANKQELADCIATDCGITVSPDAIFDVQIKRLHEYKRQHLNLLHILALYRRLLHNPAADIHPRVFIFAAKAAPGYTLAKQIIQAINAVGDIINNDTRIQDKLKIAFLPNYSVSLAERIIPAADLSEQISTAGKEASGTGNMKMALNGALTIGTLDGANVEIQEAVGDDNIFIFGNTVEDVERIREQGYNPWNHYHNDPELRAVLDWLSTDFFTPNDPGAIRPVYHSLLDGGDPYLVLADFAAYLRAQAEVDKTYRRPKEWAKMAILNTARMGKFSSDRTISEYANEIWKLDPCR